MKKKKAKKRVRRLNMHDWREGENCKWRGRRVDVQVGGKSKRKQIEKGPLFLST